MSRFSSGVLIKWSLIVMRKAVSFAALICSMLILMLSVGGVAASAADFSALEAVYATVPDESTWEDYTDTTQLSIFVDLAEMILANENSSQDIIDHCTAQLQSAIDALRYHTQGISLDKTMLTQNVGDSFNLVATLTPADAGDSITWKSDNDAIKVTDSGECTVESYTSKPVTVSAQSNGFSAECTVYVKNPLAGVNVKSTVSVYETKTITLEPTFYGKDASAPTTDTVTYTWTSGDTSIAKVSSDGVVTGVKEGTCTVRINATNGINGCFADCEVVVKKFVPVAALTPATITGVKGIQVLESDSETFRLSVYPLNATQPKIKWTSSDKAIASVEALETNNDYIAGAVITGKKEGKVTITYSTTDGSNITGRFTVTVQPLIKEITFDSASYVLNPGKTKQIEATIIPENAGRQALMWSSSDDDVCSVDYNGKLTAKSVGVCVISAAADDGSSVVRTCNVRVAPEAKSIKLSESEITLINGTKTILGVVVTTKDGSTYSGGKEVKWKSSDKNIATVNSSGRVSAKGSGTVTITATAKDGTGVKATCKVTVITPVEGVSIASKVTLGVGKTKTLVPKFTPEKPSNTNVKWRSSNKSVATVSSSGKITAVSTGTATITCTTEDGGFKAKCTVTVVIPVESIELNKTDVKLVVGKRTQLKPTLLPIDATDRSYKWSSSDPKIARISENGYITAASAGVATITVTASNGVKATCKVTCLQNVTGVELPKSEIKLYVTERRMLRYNVLPEDATNKAVRFKSSDNSVVKVSSNGRMTALKRGIATITVTTEDGGFKAKCTVTVTKKIDVTGLSVNVTQVKMKTGEKVYPEWRVLPENASEKGIIWASSDKSVATVASGSGRIWAKGPGKATIVGTSADGGFKKEIEVTVIQPVESVRVRTSRVVYVGKTYTLTATVMPENATNREVTWKSSNKSVAKVGKTSGKVTGIAPGKATITCTTADGGFTATCTVTVYQAVEGVELNKNKVTLAIGESTNLVAKISPEDASNRNVKWATTNPVIATVNSEGRVSAGFPGTVTITCTTKDGSFKAKCKVTVIRPAESIELNLESLTLNTGRSKTLTALVMPEQASLKGVTFRSTDESIVTVDENGLVKAVGPGKAKIAVESEDGYVTQYCEVTVHRAPTSVVLNKTVRKINVGESKSLTATVLPLDTHNKAVTWKSSNPEVATVDKNGVITAVKVGVVTITCTTVVDSRTATCKVYVKIPTKSVSLNLSSLTLDVGKSKTLIATVKPTDATFKDVTWKSSNKNVVKVSKDGVVTAVAVGSATITVTTEEGGYKATCFVTVPRRVTGISLEKDFYYVALGNKVQIGASVVPVTATNKDIKWVSSDTSVAKISSSGVVTALKTGKTTITATTVEGGHSITCTVQVYKPVESVTLNKTSRTLDVGDTYKLKATVLPEDATKKTVKWSSSDPSVATVDENGVITAVSIGTAVIKVRTDSSGKTAECTVRVVQIADSLTLNKRTKTMTVGKVYTFEATVLPEDARNKNVTWESTDTEIFEVTADGTVTAIAPGVATLICTSKDDETLVAQCVITVVE